LNIIKDNSDLNLVPLACIFLVCKTLHINLNIQSLRHYIDRNLTIDDLEKMVQTICLHCKGMICTPTIYDIAISQEEILWYVNQLESDCSFIEKDDKELHFKYTTEVETPDMIMNRTKVI
jgi:hypothetical protein